MTFVHSWNSWLICFSPCLCVSVVFFFLLSGKLYFGESSRMPVPPTAKLCSAYRCSYISVYMQFHWVNYGSPSHYFTFSMYSCQGRKIEPDYLIKGNYMLLLVVSIQPRASWKPIADGWLLTKMPAYRMKLHTWDYYIFDRLRKSRYNVFSSLL